MAILLISNHYNEKNIVEMLLDSTPASEVMINITMSKYKWLTEDLERMKAFITEAFAIKRVPVTEYYPIALIGTDDWNLYGNNRRKRFNMVWKVTRINGYGPNDEDLGSSLGPFVINVIDDDDE